MLFRFLAMVLFVVATSLFGGCGEPMTNDGAAGGGDGATMAIDDAENINGDEPNHIGLRHILIAFKGSIPEEVIDRTEVEAKKLAYEILERAKSGEDFRSLVREYSDDGDWPYNLANLGQPDFPSPDKNKRIYRRETMVPAFGDIGFKLKVGEVGIADFDSMTSRFGWHIIKRIK